MASPSRPAGAIRSKITNDASGAPQHPKLTASSEGGPAQPLPTRPDIVDETPPSAEQWIRLRRFYLGHRKAADDLEALDGCLPALLSPYVEGSRLRFDYPLLLHAMPTAGGGEDTLEPLGEFLVSAIAAIEGEPAGQHILRDNLARLEAGIQDALPDHSPPIAAKPLLAKAAERMQDELALDSENRARLTNALTQIMATLSPEARVLGYGPRTAIHLFVQVVRQQLAPRYEQFAQNVATLAEQLRMLLSLEWAASEAHQDPEHVEGRVGAAGAQFLDATALARVMRHVRGPQRMSSEYRLRVVKALQVLERFLEKTSRRLMTVIESSELAEEAPRPPQVLPWRERSYTCEFTTSAEPCRAANQAFVDAAHELAPVFAAIRMARLALSGQDAPEDLEAAFAALPWEEFTASELRLLPIIVVVTGANAVVGDQMAEFSRLLRSPQPVQIVVQVDPAGDLGTNSGSDTPVGRRLELGYFGISHRHAVVSQSAAARPRHLVASFRSALEAQRPGLHVLLADSHREPEAPRLHPWLKAGSAIEARGHPLFFFAPPGAPDPHDPTQVLRTGCLELQSNPQVDQDWPAYDLHYHERDGTVQSSLSPFTFADFAPLNPTLAQELRLIPEGLAADKLLPVDVYLSASDAQAAKCLPYIWVVDREGKLRRAIATQDLLIRTKDRLDFWRTLQADAGVRNAFVEKARQRAIAEAEQKARKEREGIEEAFHLELARVRQETARKAMSQLTKVLLGLDLTASTPAGNAQVAAVDDPATETPMPPPAVQPVAADEHGFESDDTVIEEPWIETPLCTSCNDCININPQLFGYDENKQARIQDPRAGSYAQLVEAAEKCPARCVHPGQPLDPDEPGIEALSERAAPFN